MTAAASGSIAFARGKFNINTSVGGSSTTVVSHTLPGRFNRVLLLPRVVGSGVHENAERAGAMVWVEDDENNGYAHSNLITLSSARNYVGTLYYWPLWRMRGYSFAVEGKLSDAMYNFPNGTTNQGVRLLKASVTNGSLSMSFDNTSTSFMSLKLDVSYMAWAK